jgi:hypothetical protein
MPIAQRSVGLQHLHMKNLSWIVLILAAAGISVLGAGCGSDGCCWGCSCPPRGIVSPGDMSGDSGVADAMSEQ